MRAPGAARPRGRERAARRRRAARHGWARLGWAEAAELSFPPPPPHPSLRPPPAHPRAAMDGGAFGAGKAGGAFDPHAFIRQPQTLLRLLSWVRGPSPTGGGLPPAAGLRRGRTDGRTPTGRGSGRRVRCGAAAATSAGRGDGGGAAPCERAVCYLCVIWAGTSLLLSRVSYVPADAPSIRMHMSAGPSPRLQSPTRRYIRVRLRKHSCLQLYMPYISIYPQLYIPTCMFGYVDLPLGLCISICTYLHIYISAYTCAHTAVQPYGRMYPCTWL